ncbi:hypothetical protein LY78DRAFT_253856 [Colletotrichum sublineola]|nr:hypothetical protein LY78DRAFT_253856 [Colletotrichum sublineola]
MKESPRMVFLVCFAGGTMRWKTTGWTRDNAALYMRPGSLLQSFGGTPTPFLFPSNCSACCIETQEGPRRYPNLEHRTCWNSFRGSDRVKEGPTRSRKCFCQRWVNTRRSLSPWPMMAAYPCSRHLSWIGGSSVSPVFSFGHTHLTVPLVQAVARLGIPSQAEDWLVVSRTGTVDPAEGYSRSLSGGTSNQVPGSLNANANAAAIRSLGQSS